MQLLHIAIRTRLYCMVILGICNFPFFLSQVTITFEKFKTLKFRTLCLKYTCYKAEKKDSTQNEITEFLLNGHEGH